MNTIKLTLLTALLLAPLAALHAAEPDRAVALEAKFGRAEFDVQAPAMTRLFLRGPDGRLSAQSLFSKEGVTSYPIPFLHGKSNAEILWARDAYTYVVSAGGERYESRQAAPDKVEATTEGGRAVWRVTGVKLCTGPGQEPVATENWTLSTPDEGQQLVWKIERRWTKDFSAVMSGSPGLFFGFHPKHLSNAVTNTLWCDPQKLTARSSQLYWAAGQFNGLVTMQDRDPWAIYKLWTSWNAPSDLRLQAEGGHLYRRGSLSLLSEAGVVTDLQAVQQRSAGQIEQIALRIGAVDKRSTGQQLNISIPDKEVEHSLQDFYGSLFNGGSIADQKRMFVGNGSDSFLCAVSAMTHGNALSAGVPAKGELSTSSYSAAKAMQGYLDHILKTVDADGGFNFGYNPHGRIFDLRLNVVIGTRMYWLHTGDLDLIRRHLPALERLLLHFIANRDEHGLFRMNERYLWYYDALPTSGVNTYFNALFYRAALDLAEMEDAVGSSEKAHEYRALADGIKTAVNKVLWREDAPGGPRYVDWIDPEGRDWMQFTDLCQWIPLAVGIAPPDRARQVIATADARMLELAKSHGYPGTATLSALWPVGWPINKNQATLGKYMSGGCLLANTYWEVVARARAGDAEGAWRRLRLFAKNAQDTSWSGDNATNIRGEFQNTGGDGEPYLSDMVVVPAALIHGIMGITPTGQGLEIAPHLPPGWQSAEAEVLYQGRRYQVTARADGTWTKKVIETK